MTMAERQVFGGCSEGILKAHEGTWALLNSLLRPVFGVRCFVGAPRAKASVITAKALEHCDGWQGVDPFRISVKHNHGYGGSSTFKVSAPLETSASPPEVAVHIVSHHRVAQMARIEAASAVFASHGLAPKRLAQGDTWYIEQWEGCGHPSMQTSKFFSDLGCLLAKVHTLPTSWFDQHRVQLCEQLPALQGVPHGSHAWCFCGHSQLDELEAEVLDAFLDPALVSPVHPVASRIVTAHGDLHAGNMLNTSNGAAMCIDFESACVTYAVFDLALGVGLAGRLSGNMANRQVLMHSYLEALGGEFDPEDVEALVFEAEMARACYLHGVLQPQGLRFSPDTACRVISAMKSFVSRARASPSLRAEIARFGFRHCANQDDAIQEAERAHAAAQAKRVEELMGGSGAEPSSPFETSNDWLGLPLGLPIFPEANLSRL
jgi:Ser/Thr protein kinase RdoA (MazF antagonist)